uniref:AT-rich interactive domain-containing protein 3 n=1 Tax=Myotis lucifugus TaxID=59463 RepID=G1QCM2_MYOLU
MEALQRQQAARLAQGMRPLAPPRPPPPQPSLPGPGILQALERASGKVGAEKEEDAGEDEEREEAGAEKEAAEESRPETRGPSSPSSQPPGPHPHEWTYEEQFKQLYELDADPKRKEFLDDLFSFMQKRGTPVNRVPIMAKQVLDLYALFRLVTAKGGLVEVINRKVWREVTRGLSLPTTITSAAFTLRTQSRSAGPGFPSARVPPAPSPIKKGCEGRRGVTETQGFGNPGVGGYCGYAAEGSFYPKQFHFTPVHPGVLFACGLVVGSIAGQGTYLAELPILPEESGIPTPRLALPVGLALGPAREKLAPEEPPEKRAVLMGAMDPPQPGAPPSFLPHGKVPLREERLDGPLNLAGSGISSINMALEINGVVYTGILFARRQPVPASQGPINPVPPTPTGPPSGISP